MDHQLALDGGKCAPCPSYPPPAPRSQQQVGERCHRSSQIRPRRLARVQADAAADCTGMLISERIKMSDTPAASVMSWSATEADCANSSVNRPLRRSRRNCWRVCFDIRLIVNHENEQAHAPPSDLSADGAMRGRTIRNSVNSPGCVSTSIDPECCLTMMS